MNQEKIKTYWQKYLATLSAGSPTHGEQYVAEYFGDSPELANELGALIVAGTKTATCSCLWEWEADGDPLPDVGLKTIVLDGNEEPLCIIETTEVAVQPYNQVDVQFAFEEGEGDRSLNYWREVHWQSFSRALPKIGRQPVQDMLLVCEKFQVIYRE